MNSIEKKTIFYFILSFVTVWILLFELILPTNNIFPKPSIVFQSFSDLFKNYDLGWNYLSTVAAVYLPMVTAYFLTRLLFPFLRKSKFISDLFSSLEWFSQIIPGIILALILIYWFPKSEFTKFIFSFLLTFSTLSFISVNRSKKLGDEYFNSLMSFRVSKGFIERQIIWKAIQPEIFQRIVKKNVYFWTSIIVFEYFNLGFGIGTIFRKILEFKDSSALIMMFLILGVTLFITNESINSIKQKFYYWKS